MTVQYAHPDEDWKDVLLSDIDLSVRTSNCLYRMGLTTLGDLARMSDAELLRQPNFSRKCLIEVRTLLSSTEGLTPSDECMSEEDTLDFGLIGEPLLSTLLRPVQTLDLTTRARNVLEIWDVTTVGELVQLTEPKILRRRNAGRLTINNIKGELGKLSLTLGTDIANWPKKDELALILESRAQSRLDRTQATVGTFNFLEDELCAAVKMTVDHSRYAVVMRRTGWDGGGILTLEELGNDSNASGRKSPVSRERIRQIERKALETIRKRAWSMPMLERTISLIEENAPLAVTTLPSMLERHQLSRRGLGFKALTVAMRTFQVEWNLVYRSIGQALFLLPPDKADTIEAVWTFLVKEADRRDFVPLDEIESVSQRASDFASDSVAFGVSKVPKLDWLDRDRQIYWSLGRACRGRNKIINVCRKILTVVPDVPFERLVTAIERARTIRDYPPLDTLMSMLRAMDDFDVHDGMVSRGANFKPDTLSKTDRLMISAAKDTGTVTTFLKLREALVRQGVSVGHAQVLMVLTPLWITTSRGKYRFIANKAQLRELSLAEPTKDDKVQESLECLVELEIGHRHLVTGTHRINENFVRSGQWSLKDEKGNDLGKIDVTSNMVKGLSDVFAAAGIGVGTFVIIDFSDEQFMATAYH